MQAMPEEDTCCLLSTFYVPGTVLSDICIIFAQLNPRVESHYIHFTDGETKDRLSNFLKINWDLNPGRPSPYPCLYPQARRVPRKLSGSSGEPSPCPWASQKGSLGRWPRGGYRGNGNGKERSRLKGRQKEASQDKLQYWRPRHKCFLEFLRM